MFTKREREKVMNKQEYDIISTLLNGSYYNQRALSEASGHSLGIVNRAIKNLIDNGYLDENIQLTSKAYQEVYEKKPENAVILAAGYGMRMVPINREVPKGLLEVNGEPLIERLINQLNEVGIYKIYIIVGFMKEQYEYLIDKYGVELIVNKDYSTKNNLHSLKKAMHLLGNTYIVPCDIWCDQNPFAKCELYSWYMVSDLVDNDSLIRVNRKMELISIPPGNAGNSMIGISYLLKSDAVKVCNNMEKLILDKTYENAFWEEALFENRKMIVQAKVVHAFDVVEINTYEQLREVDICSKQLKSNVIDEISIAMGIDTSQITNITVLKKGMTNRSFLFQSGRQKYIMRIPGEGTDQLINRKQEADVYKVLDGKDICDDIIYINPESGYKITEYLFGARVCDPENIDDVSQCMKRLREFHELRLKVDHKFDPFYQLQFYENLWGDHKSVYRDYEITKKNVLTLKEYIDKQPKEFVLSHIDAVPDNFLFIPEEKTNRNIRLIDWEYSGMQDPHIDIAMFAIYSLYDREHVDKLIDLYFLEKCEKTVRIKIYCYISVCGLLWSNWCEYKSRLGIEFGEYSLHQYRYAKEYYRIVQDELYEE